MSWFRRNGRATSSAPAPAEAQRATLQHFGDFARTRPGVEAYIEPATHVTQTTLILIAATGEWTRRGDEDEGCLGDVGGRLDVRLDTRSGAREVAEMLERGALSLGRCGGRRGSPAVAAKP